MCVLLHLLQTVTLNIKANQVNADFISRRTKTVTNTVIVLNDTYKV